MTRINRRRFTQLSGAGALAAGTGGLAGILASGRAPAYGQTAAVHWLRWADFVPASDVLLKGPIVAQCQKDLGIKLTVETINANDIQARVTSSIQSGTGPDIILGLNNWPQLYATSLADVSDLAEQLGKEGGGYYDICRVVGTYDNHWIGVPWCAGGGLVAYRKSWLAEAGAEKFPANWDDYRAVGKKLKAAGRPYGQTAGHTFGDAPGWWYPYLWSWGGKEVEADGKTVVLNTKETVESVKFAVALWKETMDEGGLSWDDTNNNRAFLSGSISATNNGASIYLEAKKKPDSYQTEKGTPMKDDILHASIPGGAGGQFNLPGPMTDMLMGYSKNKDPPRNSWRGCIPSRCTSSGSLRSRAISAVPRKCGKTTRCGTPTRSSLRSRRSRLPAACWAMPGSRRKRPPRCRPSTSSSTCMRRRSRACRPNSR